MHWEVYLELVFRCTAKDVSWLSPYDPSVTIRWQKYANAPKRLISQWSSTHQKIISRRHKLLMLSITFNASPISTHYGVNLGYSEYGRVILSHGCNDVATWRGEPCARVKKWYREERRTKTGDIESICRCTIVRICRRHPLPYLPPDMQQWNCWNVIAVQEF
jgi:hypothetical protein